jgi:hypothetical protein
MCMRPWYRSVHLVVLALLGCAAKSPAPTEPYQRVLLYTAGEWPGAAEVADRAARLAGVPVRETVQVAPNRWRMSLLCADTDACRAAMARIAADRSFALGVDAEGRVQIPAKPSREAAR